MLFESMDVSIAVQIPLGPIERMGYQYNTALVLENMAHYFDHVLVISNSPETTSLPFSSEKLEFISGPSEWPSDSGSCAARFDLEQIHRNNDRGLALLADRGFDICIQGDILQYLDDQNAEKLYSLCKEMVRNGRAWEYKYRGFQILDRIYVPSLRGARIINLHFFEKGKMRLRADQLEVGDQIFRAERGMFHDAPCFFIDIYPPLWTEDDYQEKYDYYLIKIDEFYDKPPRERSWNAHLAADLRKAQAQTRIHNYKLSDWGERALANLPSDSPIRNWSSILQEEN
ncbi:MAG: hypothetical protein KDD70_12235 [Bdellovibrionales bacterium]|nr:hypothetical protein [Bdellovibrionales bacterium]